MDNLPQLITILLVPEFSMMAFTSTVEPLRVVNRLSGREVYRVRIVSVDGEPVTASNGMTVLVNAAIEQVKDVSTILVCASFNPELYCSGRELHWLRAHAERGSCLGGLDTGSYLLAEAGLLDGYRATLHWESMAAFAETFPRVEVCEDLFHIDRQRISCAGGTAAMDLMLELIETGLGRDMALQVSDQLIHERIRKHQDTQKVGVSVRYNSHNPQLESVIGEMQRHIEDPLTMCQLAAVVGISRRHLDRLFKNYLDATPGEFYVNLRLDRARQLLEQTAMSITEIGLATGFSSSTCFSRSFRARWQCSPREHRKQKAQGRSAPQVNSLLRAEAV